jgi:hypothetical protein
MMPSVMDERHEELRSESISIDHLSEKPVTRPSGITSGLPFIGPELLTADFARRISVVAGVSRIKFRP